MNGMLPLMLAGLSVGLSNFAASIAIGLAGLDSRLRLRIALVFGLFETAMPIIGLAVGHQIADKLGGHANQIGGGLLVLTGLHMTYGALKGKDDKEVSKAADSNWGQLLFTGLALSIDNLIVGFSLGARHQSLLEAGVIIGVSSVVLSLIGLEIGERLSNKVEEYSEILSGLILVGIGLAIGFRWL